GLICLWCSRGYHESCWQQLAEQDDMIHCDYGIFRYTELQHTLGPFVILIVLHHRLLSIFNAT
ncbi:unnamed protein product, partial [Rotaria socialis]